MRVMKDSRLRSSKVWKDMEQENTVQGKGLSSVIEGRSNSQKLKHISFVIQQ